MSISIILPIYNKEIYLSRSINSILSQSFVNFELICVVDGATDNSLAVVKQFSDPRLVIIEQPNLGISAAKNNGVFHSKNEIITFIDADDEWDVDFLSEIFYLSKSYQSCNAFITGYYLNYGDNAVKRRVLGLGSHGVLTDYFYRRKTGWGVHTSSFAVRKSAFIATGGFPMLLSDANMHTAFIVDYNGCLIQKLDISLASKPQFKDGDSDFLSHNIYCKFPNHLISVPGLGGEDQYLHDLLALNFNYAFSVKVLSTWYGNVLNQVTKTNDLTKIHPHLIGLWQKILLCGESSLALKGYLRMLDSALIRDGVVIPSSLWVKYLTAHHYFSRHLLARLLKHKPYLKKALITVDLMLRVIDFLIRKVQIQGGKEIQ